MATERLDHSAGNIPEFTDSVKKLTQKTRIPEAMHNRHLSLKT